MDWLFCIKELIPECVGDSAEDYEEEVKAGQRKEEL
jgi:hypothetical protein